MYTSRDPKTVRRLRSRLRMLLPGAKSSHVAEATAAAMDYRTAVAMGHAMRDGPAVWPVEFSESRFAARLRELGDQRPSAELNGIASTAVPATRRNLVEDIHLLVTDCALTGRLANVEMELDGRDACMWMGTVDKNHERSVPREWAFALQHEAREVTVRHDDNNARYRTAVIPAARMTAPDLLETHVFWMLSEDGRKLLFGIQAWTRKKQADSERDVAEFTGRIKMASLREDGTISDLDRRLWNSPAQSKGPEADARYVAEDLIKEAWMQRRRDPIYPTTKVADRLGWTRDRMFAAIDALTGMGHAWVSRGIFLFAKPSLLRYVIGSEAFEDAASSHTPGLAENRPE